MYGPVSVRVSTYALIARLFIWTKKGQQASDMPSDLPEQCYIVYSDTVMHLVPGVRLTQDL